METDPYASHNRRSEEADLSAENLLEFMQKNEDRKGG